MKHVIKHSLIKNGLAATISFTMMQASLAEPVLTRSNGAPVGNNQNSQTAGPMGPTLLRIITCSKN